MSPNPELVSPSINHHEVRPILDQYWQVFAHIKAETEIPLLRAGLKPAGILIDTDRDWRVYCHPFGWKGIRDLKVLGGYGWEEERDVEYGYEADLVVHWGEKAGIINYSSFEGHTPKLRPFGRFFELHDGYYHTDDEKGSLKLILYKPAFAYRASLRDIYTFTQFNKRQILEPGSGALQILQNIEQGLINASQHKAEDL